MPKFLIKKHTPPGIEPGGITKDGKKTHYDLYLEYEGRWLAFALLKEPSYDMMEKRFACYLEELTDKDIEYRWGLGVVEDYDEGEYTAINDFSEELVQRKPLLRFRLKGKRLKGVWKLEKMNDYWKVGKPTMRHEADDHKYLMVKLLDKSYPENSDI